MSKVDTGCCQEACILLLSRALMLLPRHLWKSWESESLLLSKVPEACMTYWSLSLAYVTEKKAIFFCFSKAHLYPAQNRTTNCSSTDFRRRIHHPPYIFYPAKISQKMNSNDQLPGWNEGTRDFIGSKMLFNKETKYCYKNEEMMQSLIDNFKYPYSLKKNVQNALSCLFSATRY